MQLLLLCVGMHASLLSSVSCPPFFWPLQRIFGADLSCFCKIQNKQAPRYYPLNSKQHSVKLADRDCASMISYSKKSPLLLHFQHIHIFEGNPPGIIRFPALQDLASAASGVKISLQ